MKRLVHLGGFIFLCWMILWSTTACETPPNQPTLVPSPTAVQRGFQRLAIPVAGGLLPSPEGGKPLGIVALGPDVGPVGKAIAQLDTPRTMQATVNTSAFPAGAGSIALTQQLAPQVTQTGVPFASLFTGGTAVAMIAVTWV